MRIAVEGCAHGELEIIYNSIEELEKNDGKKIDLLICCGDFQSTRNYDDLASMAVPDKYKDMCTFYKYYSGEKTAPVLTIFIGGNHEASNYLQELAYGGWVAPKIYYLGYAGVVTIGGLRIAGISGIYKSHDLHKGHFELPPYDNSTIRSVYHTRNLEIFRLKQLSSNIDIFLSHDWPNGITKYGNEPDLLRRKGFFVEDIKRNALGSTPCMELLKQHLPKYWFSAHLHCKFAAVIPDENGGSTERRTEFLALDKCLQKRKFLQIVDIPHDPDKGMDLSYDLEWITILYLTNHLLSVKNSVQYMPGPGCTGRYNFTPTDAEKASLLRKFNGDLKIPENFVKTVDAFDPTMPKSIPKTSTFRVNKQTTEFCDRVGVDDPSALVFLLNGGTFAVEDVTVAERPEDDATVAERPVDDVTVTQRPADDKSAWGRLSLSSDDMLSDESLKDTSIDNHDEEMKEDSSEIEPQVKRFKGRNAAIYSDIS